jgi:flagellar biogenesis protein FliO
MEVLSQLLAVGLVLGLLAGAFWALARGKRVAWSGARWRSRQSGALSVSERLPLSQQHSLVLARVAGKALVIALHPSGATLLDTMPWREVETAVSAPASKEVL